MIRSGFARTLVQVRHTLFSQQRTQVVRRATTQALSPVHHTRPSPFPYSSLSSRTLANALAIRATAPAGQFAAQQFHNSAVTMIPILPTVLFAVPLSVPYFMLLRLAAQRILAPPTRAILTRMSVSILAAVPTVFLLASETTPLTYRWRFMLLWPWEERQLVETADECVQDLLASSTSVAKDDPRSQLLDHICHRLWQRGVLAHSLIKYGSLPEPTVHLIADDDVLDGISYPSSHITLTTGWLRIVDFDEELLAAILAHEIAHIIQHHAAEFYGMSYLMRVLAQLGQLVSKIVPNWHAFDKDANGVDGQWRRPLLFMQKHSRMLEREADVVGQEIMARAGYDPANAIELWQLMIDLERESKSQSDANKQSPPSVPTHTEHGHGVRHSTESDALAMHPKRPQRVKYLTENLMRVQRFYDTANGNEPSGKSFERDLSLWRFEVTVWAVFNRIDMNGFSANV